MKNVKETQLKKAIFMEKEELEELVQELLGWELDIEADGMWADEGDIVVTPGMDWETELREKLSQHFDVTITSIHTDNCYDALGIWLVYKD